MEQLNLTTIPTTTMLDDSLDSDNEDEKFMPSFTQPSTISQQDFTLLFQRNGSTLTDIEPEDTEELLINNKLLSGNSSSATLQIGTNHPGNRYHRHRDSNGPSRVRRGSFKIDNVEKIIKRLAMACACTFGIGSHFGSHIIGPMKGILMKQLSLTNTQFSLLVASLTLCNTVIPTVSGILVAKFGTTKSSIVVTSVVLLGMLIVTVASWTGKISAMIIGFGIFGMGLAPLTIIQETIIVHFFQGNGLGFALATGLTMGKLASFMASVLAVPLSMTQPLTYRAPFFVATLTCFVSWIMNIVYLLLLKHADDRKNKNQDGAALHQVVEKKTMHWSAIFDLSNMFWWYLVVVFLYGTSMVPFLHLSSNIIKHRFDTTDLLASWDASIVLLLPVIIYPFLGLFLDKYGKRCTILVASSVAILLTFLLLLLPPHLIHPFPPIFFFALAFSLAPLTIVTLVPLLTEHVSTGLGLYKSLDNIGATVSQTLTGLILDAHVEKVNYTIGPDGVEYGHENDDLVALKMFTFLSFLLLLSSLGFLWADQKYEGGRINSIDDGSRYHPTNDYGQLLSQDNYRTGSLQAMVIEDDTILAKEGMKKQREQARIYIGLITLLLIFCWALFGIVAWEKAGVHAQPRNPITVPLPLPSNL
ncbi:hypothetical protein G9A89_012640 [Geosiphon pyriformis]|nr:hypothetical protein G9A89_012640 [Geosiphon pyriformis]